MTYGFVSTAQGGRALNPPCDRRPRMYRLLPIVPLAFLLLLIACDSPTPTPPPVVPPTTPTGAMPQPTATATATPTPIDLSDLLAELLVNRYAFEDRYLGKRESIRARVDFVTALPLRVPIDYAGSIELEGLTRDDLARLIPPVSVIASCAIDSYNRDYHLNLLGGSNLPRIFAKECVLVSQEPVDTG